MVNKSHPIENNVIANRLSVNDKHDWKSHEQAYCLLIINYYAL